MARKGTTKASTAKEDKVVDPENKGADAKANADTSVADEPVGSLSPAEGASQDQSAAGPGAPTETTSNSAQGAGSEEPGTAGAPEATIAAITAGLTSTDDSAEGSNSGGADDGSEDAASPGWAIVVIGPKKGRWRAGRFFNQDPVKIPVSELTQAEGQMIRDDPLLACNLVGTGPET